MAPPQQDTEPEASPAPEAAPKAARAAKTRRQIPESTKRLLFIVAGVLVLAASVYGFYATSDAFDDRTAVLVAARGIEPGETVTAADFGSDLMLAGSIPHIEWTLGAQSLFDAMVAVQPIPAGALVRHDMFIAAETAPVGVELEVVVPLDLSLVTDDVFEGDLVLLVDPGAEPVEGDDGRPRRVVREFNLTNFDGAQMQLFLAPEEWAEWEALLAEVGGTLMVVDLGVGAEPEETTRRLDAVWQAQWSSAVEEIAAAAAAAAAQARPTAGPGELEVIVTFDTSLVPTAVSEGDLVLLVDPGAEPLGNDPGRPRMVIGTLTLEHYADGEMTMFEPPEQWLYWRSLPEELGATPMVLPVPDGTAIDEMTEQLNTQWRGAWRRSVTDSGAAP